MHRAVLFVVFVVACFPPQTNGGPRPDVQQTRANSTQDGSQSASEVEREEQLVRRLNRLLRICSALDNVHEQLDNMTDRKLFKTYDGPENKDGKPSKKFGSKREQDDGVETEVDVLLSQKGRLDSNLVAELVKQFNDKESKSAVKLTPASTSSLDERQLEVDATNKSHHDDDHKTNAEHQHGKPGATKRGEYDPLAVPMTDEYDPLAVPMTHQSTEQMLQEILKQLEKNKYEYGKRVATDKSHDDSHKAHTEQHGKPEGYDYVAVPMTDKSTNQMLQEILKQLEQNKYGYGKRVATDKSHHDDGHNGKPDAAKQDGYDPFAVAMTDKSTNQMLQEILEQLEQNQYGYGKRVARTIRVVDVRSVDSDNENEELMGHLHKAAALVDEADDLLVKACSHLHLTIYLLNIP